MKSFAGYSPWPNEEELELIDEVYRRIERSPRKDYVKLEDL
jgi:hypothetical protein